MFPSILRSTSAKLNRPKKRKKKLQFKTQQGPPQKSIWKKMDVALYCIALQSHSAHRARAVQFQPASATAIRAPKPQPQRSARLPDLSRAVRPT
jgi:hypothetical protein